MPQTTVTAPKTLETMSRMDLLDAKIKLQATLHLPLVPHVRAAILEQIALYTLTKATKEW